MTDLTLLHESFARNGRVNTFLLEALADAEFGLSDGQGGWTVEKHLRHMAGFRVGWLWNLSRVHAGPLLDLTQKDEDGDPQWRWHNCPPGELAEAFKAGDEAALKAVQAALTENRAFEDPWKEGAYASNPAHFLQHTIVHDSHHRGQVLALLRLGGRTPEDMDALDNHWAIWRE
ncbi:DinB family protein [Deinococcus arenicola]|uniref:Damage-inducible protein DinB n=1 Tax=Deinococcus arenicola TaxID=2994950 RepID=A0ABU4DM03_9DEIO|nr:DinB family protein [Deinococcus sp. ZS9-10]MDV6373124.1 damage-inducible protein DinB [Deinococcus sp. ZS9-10]